jgi:hypothetical protein
VTVGTTKSHGSSLVLDRLIRLLRDAGATEAEDANLVLVAAPPIIENGFLDDFSASVRARTILVGAERQEIAHHQNSLEEFLETFLPLGVLTPLAADWTKWRFIGPRSIATDMKVSVIKGLSTPSYGVWHVNEERYPNVTALMLGLAVIEHSPTPIQYTYRGPSRWKD